MSNLRLATFAATTLLAIALALPAAACAKPKGARAMVSDALSAANSYRERSGLAPMQPDAEAAAVAQKQACDMALAGKISHKGADGASFKARMRRGGLSSGSENVASGLNSGDSVVSAWMGSNGHRQNMMAIGNRRAGIGVAVDRSGKVYWAMVMTK